MKNRMLVLFVCFCSFQAFGEGIREAFVNNKAVDLVAEEDLSKASERLHRLLTEKPDLLVPKLNLSGIYETNQDYEQSLSLLSELEKSLKKIYQAADGNAKEDLKKLLYVAQFNQAFILSQDKEKRMDAVKKYAEVLELYPSDLAAKFNVELLTQNSQQQSKNSENSEEQKEDQQQKDQKGEGQNKKQQSKPQDQKKQKKKKPKFKENELKKQDVKRIFQELKRQEEQIRAKVNRQNVQEKEIEKDW